jgi:hypothetical protein
VRGEQRGEALALRLAQASACSRPSAPRPPAHASVSSSPAIAMTRTDPPRQRARGVRAAATPAAAACRKRARGRDNTRQLAPIETTAVSHPDLGCRGGAVSLGVGGRFSGPLPLRKGGGGVASNSRLQASRWRTPMRAGFVLTRSTAAIRRAAAQACRHGGAARGGSKPNRCRRRCHRSGGAQRIGLAKRFPRPCRTSPPH